MSTKVKRHGERDVTASHSMIPTRFSPSPALRERSHGRLAHLARFLTVGDDVGDEASAALTPLPLPEREAQLSRLLADPGSALTTPLRPLSQSLYPTPPWVDFTRCDRGGATLMRAGIFGGLVLGLRSLVLGYCSPGGNKPLVFSGRLKENAPRRLAETGRFFQAVCLPGGMRPGGEGFGASVRVRLVHSQVRRLLVPSPRWDSGVWGTPVNQVDMAGTILLFSLAVVDGLRLLGLRLTSEEMEDVLHLWRWVGHVMGVDSELLCGSEAEARSLWALVSETAGAPDEDSVALTHALLNSMTHPPADRGPGLPPSVVFTLSRFLIGDARADALKYPRSVLRHATPALRGLLFGGGALLQRLPLGDQLMRKAGTAYWERVVREGLEGQAARFEMPERLRHG